MRIVFVILLLTLSKLLLAQNGAVIGKVTDDLEKQPLEYATVALRSTADSSLITGTITNTEGEFILEKIPFGSYYLVVDFIGFRSTVINDVNLSADQPSFNASAIELKTGSELTELEVTGEKSLIENHIDKKIFNASQSEVSKGGNGIDLMRTVPLITVDENDNISLRGDANVTIFIDGRPSAIPIADLLKQIPASSIDKVELITNPSAKYDPEGTSGIINIILKKEKMVGFNGTFSTSFGYSKFHKTNNSLALNYRNKKWNVSSTMGLSNRKIWFGGDLDRDVLLGDTLWDRLRQTDYGERSNTGLSGSLGIDYFLNDKNTLYASYSINHGQNDGERLVNYTNIDENGATLSYSERLGIIDVPSNNQTLNFGWQKTFKNPGHTLDLDVNLSSYGSLADERLTQDYFINDDVVATTYQNTLSDNRFDTYLAKLDYVYPINDSTKLEAGFHFTHRKGQIDFYSESGIAEDSISPDTALINDFSYTQDVYAPYITLSKQFGKFSAKAGIRAEQTNTLSHLITTDDKFTNDYFMLFPSVYLSYKFNETTEMQLSYGKRINRPEQQQLNPFTNYSDPLVLQTGNPFLQPEVIHVNELNFTKYWKKFNINASGYYRLINNLIRRNLSYSGVQSTVSYTNLGKSSLYGGDLILTVTPVKGVRIMSTTNVWNTATNDPEFSNGETINLMGLTSSLTVSGRFGKGWSAQLWSSITPKQTVLQGSIIPNYGAGFAVGKSILNNKGRLTLSFIDVFKTRRFGFEATPLPHYTFTSNRRWESRSAYVSFSYSFGKVVQGKKKRATKDNDSSDDISIPDMQ
ncbi:TonB-dependent receptor domain-containing protein [Parvicella tangerina]|uniref:Vitamin B12 transporter BtuB n=1 Tax=Parvicella tangerina TaxID=2829795 RepID=A0A916NHP0_9FLAO|nr:TonB-dependent receptor [Parvicella tangerina]CAG5081979.1 Vitamin B12 transporter BtuB [Parvicella tangerina]